jgi:predicted Zn-dependent peptidase
MIKYNKTTLNNGLKLIVNEDKATHLATVNILYNVGAKHENPEKTGFAHLFEHLMFGGSKNIQQFDKYVELAGGINNAFTNNDLTNYYITLPASNIETAFWLESDRMLALDFSQQKLDIQRQVVIEEYKQRYLNQPYGDVWLILRPLAYKKHPYQWPTIGKDISHIEKARLNDVEDFFYTHYAPNNAIISVSSNKPFNEIVDIANKWFKDIESRPLADKNIPKEPKQTKSRQLRVERDVPYDMICKAYHVCNRNDEKYPATDLISDILGNGTSSRFYENLVKRQKLFTHLDVFITGDIDEGLLVVKGMLNENTTMVDAENAINNTLQNLAKAPPSQDELQKVKNKFEASYLLSNTTTFSKAFHLAYYELTGNADKINHEIDQYKKVTPTSLNKVAKEIFTESNSINLYYHANK